jgi:hypothetical protein
MPTGKSGALRPVGRITLAPECSSGDVGKLGIPQAQSDAHSRQGGGRYVPIVRAVSKNTMRTSAVRRLWHFVG